MASILPPHLSELERDLDAAMARLAAIDIPISTLWNPHTCPVEVLPYLAWAMSVDTWRSHWAEDMKRQVILAAPDVHRTKGTRPAVEMALAALNVEVELKEWWEASPQGTPGTFELVAYINRHLGTGNELLGADTLQLIRQAVDNHNRASAHYELRLGLKLNGELNQTGGVEPVRGDIDHTLNVPAIYAAPISAPLGLSGSKNTRVDSDVTLNSTPKDKQVTGRVFMAGSLYHHQTLDLIIGSKT
jgi:phage tail P2-like protein